MMIIWVMKIFFVQFFCVFLLSLFDIFCFKHLNTEPMLQSDHPQTDGPISGLPQQRPPDPPPTSMVLPDSLAHTV